MRENVRKAPVVLKQKKLADYQVWLRSELANHPETTDCSLVAENGQSLKVHLSLLIQIWPLVETLKIPEKNLCMCDRTVIFLAKTKLSTIQNFLDLLYLGRCFTVLLSEVQELEEFSSRMGFVWHVSLMEESSPGLLMVKKADSFKYKDLPFANESSDDETDVTLTKCADDDTTRIEKPSQKIRDFSFANESSDDETDVTKCGDDDTSRFEKPTQKYRDFSFANESSDDETGVGSLVTECANTVPKSKYSLPSVIYTTNKVPSLSVQGVICEKDSICSLNCQENCKVVLGTWRNKDKNEIKDIFAGLNLVNKQKRLMRQLEFQEKSGLYRWILLQKTIALC